MKTPTTWGHCAMYYPDQRYASELTVIRREALLPDEAVGTLRTTEGKDVDFRDVVANGVVPSRYIILDVMAAFGLRRAEAAEKLLLVSQGDVVKEDQALAGKSADRGKRLLSPVRGVVARIAEGRIIVQAMPGVVDVQAGVRGKVIQVTPGRGAVVQAVGAQIQGVWGNGQMHIATLRVEPDGGVETVAPDSLERRYAGAIVLTRRPLTARAFDVVDEQNFAGVIAPSMDASLIERALAFEGAILLTEGFGSTRMNVAVFNLLQKFEGNPVTLDAYQPSRWETRTPEVVANVSTRGEKKPTAPNPMLALRPGMNVRCTREPHQGLTGKVAVVHSTPVLLDNGLRVPCARVELVSGETADVPLANLEVLGR